MTDNMENTNNAECKALSIEPRVLNETIFKTDITSIKSYDLEDQQKEEDLLYTGSLYANNRNNKILNDIAIPMTKDIVISSVNNILIDLNNDVKENLTTLPRPEAQIIHREGVGINNITEVTNEIFPKSDTIYLKSDDMDDQRKEVELESVNFKLISNPTKLLYANNKEEKILIDVKPTKDLVMSAIDRLLIDLNNDVKVELTTFPRPAAHKTHRDGVRMNTTALRREMYIKNRLQKK
ncbi:uncharacterized protein LOC113551034 [Rhopalosiphum maidis]|uniref:uncharacterized protein LOC113551034 n=1 Tax=Rhopalosiphum maidis TaxID=43146 RepID=UPI000EFE4EFD|nr:uncharacterized protein LOC113551034 [Rhopalosiphum maidis]